MLPINWSLNQEVWIRPQKNEDHSWNNSILHLMDVMELVDYIVATPLCSRYFTHLIDGQTETISDSGLSAKLYRVYRDESKQKHGSGVGIYIAETEKEKFQTSRRL